MGRFGFFGEEALSLIADDLVEDNEIVQTSLLALEVIDLNDFCNKVLSVVDRGMRFLHFDAAQIVSLKDGSCGEFLNVGLCVEFLVDGFYANGGSTSLGNVKRLLFGHEQHKLFDRGWISMMVLMWLMIWCLFVDACDLGAFGAVDFDRYWLLMVLWRGSLILLLGWRRQFWLFLVVFCWFFSRLLHHWWRSTLGRWWAGGRQGVGVTWVPLEHEEAGCWDSSDPKGHKAWGVYFSIDEGESVLSVLD